MTDEEAIEIFEQINKDPVMETFRNKIKEALEVRDEEKITRLVKESKEYIRQNYSPDLKLLLRKQMFNNL